MVKKNRLRTILLLTILWFATTVRSQDSVAVICGFEKDEVTGWGATFSSSNDSSYVTSQFTYYVNIGAGDTKEATEGSYSLIRNVVNSWHFLNPNNTTDDYILHRTGCLLNTHGWFHRALPKDWSGFTKLWLDFKAKETGVTIRFDLEDAFIANPITRTFQVPADQWVTLEVDLAKAVQDRGLDLTKMANLMITITELSTDVDTVRARVDNIRLAEQNASPNNGLSLLTDTGSMLIPPPVIPNPVNLGAVALTDGALSGAVGVITIPTGSYPLLTGRERAIGGFGTSGVVAMIGAKAYLSLDGGITWTFLNGSSTYQQLTSDMRAHRATVLVDGTDIMAAYITSACAGGGGRTMQKFTKAVYNGSRYVCGPEVVFETGVRHCTDRLSMIRTGAGRIWVAWNHTPVSLWTATEAHAKYSDDGGIAWNDGGHNGLVGTGSSGPYLTEWNGQAACFYDDKWSYFDGQDWSTPAIVSSGIKAYSVVTVNNKIYLASSDPARVMCYDGSSWTIDSPPGAGTGLLSHCGNYVVCVWGSGTQILMSTKDVDGGSWCAPVELAVETGTRQGLAVPQNSPPTFLPVAWSTSLGNLKVVSYPMTGFVGIQEKPAKSNTASVCLNSYPNPFNQSTVIRYRLAEKSNVSFKIYNTQGQVLKTFSEANKEPGEHAFTWRTAGLTQGVYYVQFTSGKHKLIKKLVSLK